MASKGNRPEERHPTEPRRSFAEWLSESIDGFDLLEHHTRGSLPVQMHLQRLHEAVPDPPTPDYALTLVTSGSCSSGTEVDLGHGRFRHVPNGAFSKSPAPDFPQ